MNKKIISKKIVITLSLCITLLLFACQSKPKEEDVMYLGGESYPAIFVKSGYYFDKASLSDATLGEMLSKVEEVEKPKSLGTVDIPNFKTITLTNMKQEEVDRSMIEAELERERDEETVYNPIKTRRDSKMTDKVVIDFKGIVDGEELEGGSGEDFELVLGSGQFIPGFEEKVAGHQAGKRFNIDVTFPENYDPSLAGKDATFEIVIKSIEEATTPEVDEEFVKRHTKENSTTVAEYEDEVKRRIEKRNSFMNNQNLIYQLSDNLFQNTKFYPTEEALAWQFSALISQYNTQAAQNGSNFIDMITMSGETVKEAYDEIKSAVPQAVQSTMLMDELKKKYTVSVSENDVKTWFDDLSEAMGYGNQVTFDDYKEYMGYDNLKEAVEQEKILLKVVESCNIVDEEVEE